MTHMPSKSARTLALAPCSYTFDLMDGIIVGDLVKRKRMSESVRESLGPHSREVWA